jgi:hypothetical protein
MARTLCHGKFSEATKRLLRDEEEKGGGVAFLSQLCETCGRCVVAENKSGQWSPRTHYPPSRRACKSDKTGRK